MPRDRGTRHRDAASAAVTASAPEFVVEVLPDQTVARGEMEYLEGDRFECHSGLAMALMQNGHVTIVGLAE